MPPAPTSPTTIPRGERVYTRTLPHGRGYDYRRRTFYTQNEAPKLTLLLSTRTHVEHVEHVELPDYITFREKHAHVEHFSPTLERLPGYG